MSRSALHCASEKGHVEIEQSRLKAGAGERASGERGGTALHHACYHGHLQVVKVLVEAGSKIDALAGENMATSLMLAAFEGHTDVADLLLTCGVSVNTLDSQSRSALHFAIEAGHIEIVIMLLESGADADVLLKDIIVRKDSEALHLACYAGRLEVVRTLICHTETSSRIDQYDKHKCTPLMIAADKGHTDIVDHLLTCGASVSKIGSKSRSALHCASEKGHVKVVHSLLKAGADVHALSDSTSGERGATALHLACCHGHLQVVKVLVEAGSKVNAFDGSGDTPLKLATLKDHNEIVDHLLTCVALVNETGVESKLDEQESHQLCSAVSLGDTNEVHTILREGFDVDKRNRYGETALHLAAERPYSFECMKVLLDTAHIDSVDNNCYTPLARAVVSRNYASMAYLVQCGADVERHGDLLSEKQCTLALSDLIKHNYEAATEAFISHGLGTRGLLSTTPPMTALMWAAQKGKDGLVKQLIQQRVNITEQNPDDNTALHFACESKSIDVLELLLDTDSDSGVDTATKDHFTPLLLAVCDSDKDVVLLLLEHGACVNKMGCYKHCWTPLHVAVQKDELGMVELLLSKGAQTEVLDKYQHTPLVLAALAEKFNVMCELLANGANPLQLNSLDKHAACKALSFLINSNNENAAELLISNRVGTRGLLSTTPPMTALMWAAQKGKDGLVKQLIQQRVNITELNPDDNTALHFACESKSIDVLELLLGTGSDSGVDTANNDHFTPLLLAVCDSDREIASRLLEHGADVNKRGYYKHHQTPLHVAAQTGQLGMVEVLLSKGAQKEVLDKYQHTPLASAALAEKFNVMCALLANGANPSQLNSLDKHAACKALSFLMKNYNVDAAELLISNGVGTRGLLSTTPPMTALMWAAQKGKDGLVKQLILEGVSLSERNPNGNSALHFAAQHNHIQCGILLAEGGADVQSVLGEENLEAQETVGTLHLVTTEFRAAIMQALSFQTKKTVCVIGNAQSGKSTLIAALIKLENLTMRARLFGVQDSDITERTVGIEPVTISSKRFGEVMFFDFAGQHEYHGPHELFLESILSRGSVTVIIVVKATEDEPVITQQLKRWLHPFVQVPSSESEISVVVVGSHKDKVKSKVEAEEKLGLSLRKLKDDFSDVKFHDTCFLDCRKPQAKGISDLCQLLSRIPLPKLTATDSVYSIPWVISQIHSSLEVKALSLLVLSKWITVGRSNLPAKLPPVDKLCSDLSSTGHFLYLPNKEDIFKGWLVLDLPAILHKVYGTIFSPFNRVVNELGLFSCSRLPLLFPTFDPDMIRKILVSLDFCLELDSSLHTDLELAGIVDNSDSSLFFPSLVQAERPDNIFQREVTGSFMLCWQLRVSTDMFISPRLLQTIILRLAARHVFHNTKAVVESRSSVCKLWCNGIYWPSTEDVNVAVQISDSSIVHVIGRSVVTPSALCAYYVSTVTQSIFSTIQDLSPGLSCRACIVHPGRPRELLARPKAVSPQEMFPVDFILESRQKQAATCAPLKGTERKFIKELFGFEPDADLIEKFDFMIQTDPTGQTVPESASRLSTQPQTVSQPTTVTSQQFQQLLVDYKERMCSEVDSDAICTPLEVENIISEKVAHKISQVNRREGNGLLFLHLRKQGDIATLKVFSEVLVQVGVKEGGYARMGRLGSCLLKSISELEDSASSSPVTDTEDEDMHSYITLVEHQDLLDCSLSSGSSTEALPM